MWHVGRNLSGSLLLWNEQFAWAVHTLEPEKDSIGSISHPNTRHIQVCVYTHTQQHQRHKSPHTHSALTTVSVWEVKPCSNTPPCQEQHCDNSMCVLVSVYMWLLLGREDTCAWGVFVFVFASLSVCFSALGWASALALFEVVLSAKWQGIRVVHLAPSMAERGDEHRFYACRWAQTTVHWIASTGSAACVLGLGWRRDWAVSMWRKRCAGLRCSDVTLRLHLG